MGREVWHSPEKKSEDYKQSVYKLLFNHVENETLERTVFRWLTTLEKPNATALRTYQ